MNTHTSRLGGLSLVGAVTLLLLLLVAAGCSSAPAAPVEERQMVVDSQRQTPANAEAQPGTRPVNFSGERSVQHHNPARLVYNRFGQLQVSPEPPTEVPEIRVAADGRDGFYVPTVDYLEQLPYGLLLYHDQDQARWLVIENPLDEQAWDIRGMGTVREREGGLEFAERRGEGDEVVGIEQFPAQLARNRFTVREARQSQGRTAFGDLMRQLGPEVHWVRVTVLDRDMEPMYTARLVGTFHPTTRPNEASDILEVDTNRRLVIWPDGQWRMVSQHAEGTVPTGSPEQTVHGGTWTLDGEGRITFTQTLPPDRAATPPVETFAFVFHPVHKILWLTKVEAPSPGSETAVLPLLHGDTTVYQLQRQPQ